MGGAVRKKGGGGSLLYKRGGERTAGTPLRHGDPKKEEWVKYDGSEICGDESIICRVLNPKTSSQHFLFKYRVNPKSPFLPIFVRFSLPFFFIIFFFLLNPCFLSFFFYFHYFLLFHTLSNQLFYLPTSQKFMFY